MIYYRTMNFRNFLNILRLTNMKWLPLPLVKEWIFFIFVSFNTTTRHLLLYNYSCSIDALYHKQHLKNIWSYFELIRPSDKALLRGALISALSKSVG